MRLHAVLESDLANGQSKISPNFETLFSSEMKGDPLSSNVSLGEKV